jgi:hypothetical protein
MHAAAVEDLFGFVPFQCHLPTAQNYRSLSTFLIVLPAGKKVKIKKSRETIGKHLSTAKLFML